MGPTDHPPLCTVQDQKLTGMLTCAAPDCGLQTGGNHLTLRWSVIAVKPSRRGGSAWSRRSRIFDGKTPKWTSKCHFFDVLSEIEKDLEGDSAGTGFFKSSTSEFCPEFDV